MSEDTLDPRPISSVPALPNAVLGMALFLFTEVMLFAGLVSAYVVLRGQSLIWPPPGQPRLPVTVAAVNSLVLLASGYAMWCSVAAYRARGARAAAGQFGIALVLGASFLAIQGSEWSRLLAYGLSSETSVYAGAFYATVGIHALHVLAAVIALGWGLAKLGRGALGLDGIRALRMYWSFVVLIWPVLYVLVYLW